MKAIFRNTKWKCSVYIKSSGSNRNVIKSRNRHYDNIEATTDIDFAANLMRHTVDFNEDVIEDGYEKVD